MKSIMKSILGLQMTAMFLTAALATPTSSLAAPPSGHDVNVTNSSLSVAPQAATMHFSTRLEASPSNNEKVVVLLEPINASLITFTNMRGTGRAQVFGVDSSLLLNYSTEGSDVVLPLTQPLTVSMVRVFCPFDSATPCSAEFNLRGR